MVIRSVPLALLCVVLLGAACQGTGSGAPAAAVNTVNTPSPKPPSLAQRAVKSDHSISQPVRNGAPATPAAPHATQSPSLSAVYANAIQVAAQHLLAADGLRVTNCTAKSTPGCLSALQQVTTSANTLQQVLDANPAPDCLKSADQTLRSAISLYLQGAQLDTQGLNAGNASQVSQGKSLLDLGTTRFRAGSTQLGQSACSAPPPAVAP
jgi:hypothetical protein